MKKITSKELERLTSRGEGLYDNFIRLLNKSYGITLKVSNPRTNTLQLFAVLEREKMSPQLISAMCRELAQDVVVEGLFTEQGVLYQKFTGSKPYKL